MIYSYFRHNFMPDDILPDYYYSSLIYNQTNEIVVYLSLIWSINQQKIRGIPFQLIHTYISHTHKQVSNHSLHKFNAESNEASMCSIVIKETICTASPCQILCRACNDINGQNDWKLKSGMDGWIHPF